MSASALTSASASAPFSRSISSKRHLCSRPSIWRRICAYFPPRRKDSTPKSDPMSPSKPHVAPGDLVAHRFLVEREVAVGGMGAIYRADDRQSGTRVALKIIRHHHMD